MSPARPKTVSAKISGIRDGRHAHQRRRAVYQVHLTVLPGRVVTQRVAEAPQASSEADENSVPARAGQTA